MGHNVHSLMNKLNYILLSIVMGLATPLAIAENMQNNQSPMINNKPIAIDADNQQVDLKNNTITFSGHVIIIQDGLQIKANTVVITNMDSKNDQIITAHGTPVDIKKTDTLNPQQNILGHSDKLIYAVKKNTVTMLGHAELQQQESIIVSNKIIYDVDKEQIFAQSAQGSRVKTTIIPNQVKEINK